MLNPNKKVNVELWLDSPYQGYSCSTLGGVRGPRGRVLSPGILRNALQVTVYTPARKSIKVHRLILETFVGPCPTGLECRHLNGKWWDNRLENLKWGTHQENMEDRRLHDMNMVGSRNGASILTEDDVLVIRTAYAAGLDTYASLAERFSVSRGCIWTVLKGHNWKHVGVDSGA